MFFSYRDRRFEALDFRASRFIHFIIRKARDRRARVAAARMIRQQHLRPDLDFENITLPCARLPSYLSSPR
jgi:hypothetical protein